MPPRPYANLCPGCFADKGRASVCPHCGYDESAPRGLLVLPHRTVLNNQYLIGCTLGKLGGFGITYLAWDTHLETPVAIKEYLPRELAGRDSNRLTVTAHSRDDNALFREGLELFLKEARTLAKFDHENIVRVRNVLEENGTAYLVMNFYEGTTLAAHLEQKGGRLPEKIALSILLPVLDGLREVHSKGFLHRDIKPQNIYLAKSGTPILLDFGSARMLMGGRARSMTVLMTPGYTPFEQYHRNGHQGPWTDIYACGATLYQMLTGTVPIEATERAEKDTLQPPERLVSGISPAVSNMVMRALAMNREARPSSVVEFMDALIQANRSPLPPPPIPLESIKTEENGNATATRNTLPEAQEETLSPYFKAALGKVSVSYYLKIFSNFNSNWLELLKPSWNSAGFIFNVFWLFNKRMFGLGVLFFLLPILMMIIFDSKIIGLLCWSTLALIIGCYGNAFYFHALSRRIFNIEKQFPSSRLHPLKLVRLATANEPSILIPFIYFLIALVAFYSQGQFHQWFLKKPEINATLAGKPSKQSHLHTSDDSLNENTETKLSYDAYLYKEKADQLLNNSDWPALLEHAKKWCNLDRANPEAWLAFGIANFELGQFSLAQPAFETYFRLKPEDNDNVLGYLVKTYLKLKKSAAAERSLLKLIALRSKFNRPRSTDDAFFYNELGNIYFASTEKLQGALQLYQQALEIEPDNETIKANVDVTLKALAQQSGAEPPISNVTAENVLPNDSLSAAAASGDIPAAQLLLAKGADINKGELGSYPLIQAAKHRQDGMVDYLLKSGADVNVEDSSGNNAITYSIVNGDKKTMDILTNAGAFHN